MEKVQQTSKPTAWGSTAQPTAKVTIDSLSDGWQKRSIQEALDEVARELGVRERIYVRWIDQKTQTESDARDRMQRMIKAASILQAIVDDAGLLGAVESQL